MLRSVNEFVVWCIIDGEKIDCLIQSIVIKAVKSRRMKWAGYVPHMQETGNAYKILVCKFQGIFGCFSPYLEDETRFYFISETCSLQPKI
jgi:hypothetical protein